jgi:hypothetical protein
MFITDRANKRKCETQFNSTSKEIHLLKKVLKEAGKRTKIEFGSPSITF